MARSNFYWNDRVEIKLLRPEAARLLGFPKRHSRQSTSPRNQTSKSAEIPDLKSEHLKSKTAGES